MVVAPPDLLRTITVTHDGVPKDDLDALIDELAEVDPGLRDRVAAALERRERLHQVDSTPVRTEPDRRRR
jgi:hypothetical protein